MTRHDCSQPTRAPGVQGLYDPRLEHDACGVGFVVNIKGVRSHKLVDQALEVALNLLHRGACGCETNTGDGAGLLLQVPDKFLRRETAALGFTLPATGEYGVGMLFLPRRMDERARIEALVTRIVAEEAQTLLGWRDVPTDDTPLGETARQGEPAMRQVFIGRGGGRGDGPDAQAWFERKLYVIRKRIAREADGLALDESHLFYIASLSSQTIVYKGMLIADQVTTMFPDLVEPDFESALALVHSRFSTNTFPSWPLAHPYRYIAHNGEINTLRGNINWMRAREALCESDLFGDDLEKLFPVIREGQSDTATFDSVLEFLVMTGRSLPHAILMMIPEPWSKHESMSPDRKAFYEYHASLMEPWDGPASIAFTDGTVVGAVLDRNGLRPSRYYVTTDDMVIMASEVGVLDIPPENVLVKERLHPGRIFLVDTAQGRIIDDEEIKADLAAEHPYREWLDTHVIHLRDLADAPYAAPPDRESILRRQRAFGYTEEDLRLLLGPMAATGAEPIGSMGTDTALAVLSDRPRLLYDYFKQLFAQVTNPPLDAIREELVTDMSSTLGPERNLLKPEPESCHQMRVDYPILDNEELAKLRHSADSTLRGVTLPMLFDAGGGAAGLERAMDALCRQASEAVEAEYVFLVLSDRGVDAAHAPIPSL
ncbi:MAG: glutamate synthase central domain-containing protein, partial [Acidobacteriota bacterium]|nr:glutamate synthase central domain-containing protein [Acidobacteriota bacterium]